MSKPNKSDKIKSAAKDKTTTYKLAFRPSLYINIKNDRNTKADPASGCSMISIGGINTKPIATSADLFSTNFIL